MERKKIITTAIENKSVFEPCQWMSIQGYDLIVLTVSSDGVVDVETAVDYTADFFGISINGAKASRLSATCSILIPNIPTDGLMAHVPTLCISDGSACLSGVYAPSHVIQVLGYSSDYARNMIKIFIGRYNTERETNIAARMLVSAVKNIRAQLIRSTSCLSFPRRQEERK